MNRQNTCQACLLYDNQTELTLQKIAALRAAKDTSGIPRHNGTYETRWLPSHDARAITQDLSLDREGFAIVTYPSAVQPPRESIELRTLVFYAA